MHAFDYISIFFSFVFAAAAVHIIATAGDIMIAFKRVRFSWVNAGWMLALLLSVSAWWIGVWDLRAIGVWTMPFIFFFFGIGCLLYLLVRLVCAPIPAEGPIDLVAFHYTEGRKFLSADFALCLITIGTNIYFAGGQPTWGSQNIAIIPMALNSLAAALFISVRWIQVSSIILRLAIWVWYFAALQPAMSG